MKRVGFLCLVASVASLLSGCANPPYAIAPLHEETRRERLDAQWFTREISDGNGLQAVELVYCPLEPKVSMVCRTAIVWRRDQSALIDTAPTGTVTSAAPTPAVVP